MKQRKFKRQFKTLVAQSKNGNARFELEWNSRRSLLDDDTGSTVFDRHYVYFPGWALRKLKDFNPEMHTDIGSALSFVAMASAFFKVNFYDYRPADIKLSNLETGAVNLMHTDFASNSIYSLSCLHVLEHIGLGRYGDPLNYKGDLLAFKELARILAKGGMLLLVVPVGGKSKIVFNAHRIYTSDQVIEMASENGLNLTEYTLIPERNQDGGLITSPSSELELRQEYACGCFAFTKP